MLQQILLLTSQKIISVELFTGRMRKSKTITKCDMPPNVRIKTHLEKGIFFILETLRVISQIHGHEKLFGYEKIIDMFTGNIYLVKVFGSYFPFCVKLY